MYEEPYRWIEAVANRRQYLDDQFTQGNPLVGVSFSQGILLLTFNGVRKRSMKFTIALR
jgi:proteasome alpha subunit